MAAALKIVWTSPALDDLDDIAGFIALDDARAAAQLVERALLGVERLARHPASGRRVPELQGTTYREVIVAPCRIIYRCERGGEGRGERRGEGRCVVIVYVLRGEQRLRLGRLRDSKE